MSKVEYKPDTLIGKTFNSWTILDQVEGKIYRCKCCCGTERDLNIYKVVGGYSKSCGHRELTVKENEQYGEWTTLEYLGNRKWLCKCSCGNIQEVGTYQLHAGLSKSCGHNTAKLKDLTGQVFGELTAIQYMGDRKWKCRCSCDNIVVVNTRDLKSGNTKSCGHIKRNRKVIDLTGQIFGEWTAVEYVGNSYWRCICSCGNVKNVHAYTLKNGKSTNCGRDIHRIKDLTGRKFGELTAIKYCGNMHWICRCSCNNIKIVRSGNLLNGSTNSCGCKTNELRINTLIDKYGEISSSKARSDNKRDQQQLKILLDPQNLAAYANNRAIELNRKLTIHELARLLNVTPYTMKSYLNEYDLINVVQTLKSTSRSQLEIDVESYCKTLLEDEDIITSDRTVLNGKELDIYIPSKRLAIEFNGNYWHSTLYKDSSYHQQKSVQCIENGIRLIHIFEYEWINDEQRKKVKSLLRNAICDEGIQKIHARKCDIDINLSVSEADEFLNKYHLQNKAQSQIRYGLRHNNELVGVMTFGRPRFNNDYEWEIIRMAWKDGYRVVGGVYKLYSKFIKEHNPNSVISYCNIAKFTGNIYNMLNFNADDTLTQPNYVWIDPHNNDVLTRYQTQKQKLLDNGFGIYGDTEREIMENLGYLQIYDAGNVRYIWNKE